MSSFALPLAILAMGLILVMKDDDPDSSTESSLQIARRHAFHTIASASQGSTVVFDFDDTLVNPKNVVTHKHTGYRDVWHGDRKSVPIYSPVREIIDVCKYANSRNMHVVIITARVESENMRRTIKANSDYYGINIHEIHGYRPGFHSLHSFKSEIRHTLNETRPVILTIGDRWADVRNPESAHWIKLPSVDGMFRSSID